MNILKKNFQIVLAVAIVAGGVFASYVIVAHAQTADSTSSPQAAATSTIVSPASFQYPIADLGNCSSVSDCRNYCNDPQNQSACLAFAEQNHLMTQAQVQRAQQFLSLVQSGQTPGHCDSAQSCRTYCGDSAHAAECLNFAEQAGFITAAQANLIKQSDGRGPGGCDSAESCANYCNSSQNQTACLDFAKQHGIISQSEAGDIQEGAAGLRIGLQQFPGQVVSCLKSSLGDNAVGELESGRITPNASTSAAVSTCFATFKSQIQSRFQNMIQNASGTVAACFQGIGSSTLAALSQGNFRAVGSRIGERVRECLQEADQNREGAQNASSSAQDQARNLEREMNQNVNRFQNQLQGLPDRVKNCVIPYIVMHPSSTDIGPIVSQCMQTYGSSTQSGEGEGPAGFIRQILPSGTSTLPQPQGGPNPMIPGGDRGPNGRGGDN